jgi:hypothetical protein
MVVFAASLCAIREVIRYREVLNASEIFSQTCILGGRNAMSFKMQKVAW